MGEGAYLSFVTLLGGLAQRHPGSARIKLEIASLVRTKVCIDVRLISH